MGIYLGLGLDRSCTVYDPITMLRSLTCVDKADEYCHNEYALFVSVPPPFAVFINDLNSVLVTYASGITGARHCNKNLYFVVSDRVSSCYRYHVLLYYLLKLST